jgi:hypothetical protein
VDRPNAVTLITLRLPRELRICQVAIIDYTRWPFRRIHLPGTSVDQGIILCERCSRSLTHGREGRGGLMSDAASGGRKLLSVGGVRVEPGDVVVMDGAVVVLAGRAAEVLEAGQRREADEAAMMDELRAGALTLDLMGLREKLGPRPKRNG